MSQEVVKSELEINLDEAISQLQKPEGEISEEDFAGILSFFNENATSVETDAPEFQKIIELAITLMEKLSTVSDNAERTDILNNYLGEFFCLFYALLAPDQIARMYKNFVANAHYLNKELKSTLIAAFCKMDPETMGLPIMIELATLLMRNLNGLISDNEEKATLINEHFRSFFEKYVESLSPNQIMVMCGNFAANAHLLSSDFTQNLSEIIFECTNTDSIDNLADYQLQAIAKLAFNYVSKNPDADLIPILNIMTRKLFNIKKINPELIDDTDVFRNILSLTFEYINSYDKDDHTNLSDAVQNSLEIVLLLLGELTLRESIIKDKEEKSAFLNDDFWPFFEFVQENELVTPTQTLLFIIRFTIALSYCNEEIQKQLLHIVIDEITKLIDPTSEKKILRLVIIVFRALTYCENFALLDKKDDTDLGKPALLKIIFTSIAQFLNPEQDPTVLANAVAVFRNLTYTDNFDLLDNDEELGKPALLKIIFTSIAQFLKPEQDPTVLANAVDVFRNLTYTYNFDLLDNDEELGKPALLKIIFTSIAQFLKPEQDPTVLHNAVDVFINLYLTENFSYLREHDLLSPETLEQITNSIQLENISDQTVLERATALFQNLSNIPFINESIVTNLIHMLNNKVITERTLRWAVLVLVKVCDNEELKNIIKDTIDWGKLNTCYPGNVKISSLYIKSHNLPISFINQQFLRLCSAQTNQTNQPNPNKLKRGQNR